MNKKMFLSDFMALVSNGYGRVKGRKRTGNCKLFRIVKVVSFYIK